MIIGVINNPDKTESKNVNENVQSIPQETSKKVGVKVPADQSQFISTVEEFVDQYESAKNELQQSEMRRQRKDAIRNSLQSLNINGWIGRIRGLATNTDGDAILAIEISSNIKIKTWNNAFSDSGVNTLIRNQSPVYNSLLNLESGQTVVFSGQFFMSETDSIKETSLTIDGSMRSPEFLFKFNSVQQIK